MIDDNPEPSLPRSSVLNYFTSVSTPTRVRIISAFSLRVTATVYLLLSGFLIYAIAADVHDNPRAPKLAKVSDISDLLTIIVDEESPFLIFLAVTATCGIMHVALAGAVKRGRKAACLAASLPLLPLMVLTLFLSLFFFLWACLAFDSLSGGFHPWYLLLLVPALIAAALVVLLKDLVVFLFWITRHPITEKLPVSILTGKEKK